MSLRIRQIVVAARDLDATVAHFTAVLGIEVCYRDPGVGEFGLHNALMPIGDQFLEVVSPIRENTAAGRHIERLGDSGYMLILQTDDLDRDRARFSQLGVRLVWESNYPDVRSVHLHPKDIGGAIVSLDQTTPPKSWRWAGPDWQQHVKPDGASEVLEATFSARDPRALAARYAEVLATTPPQNSNGTARIAIERGALNFLPSSHSVDALSGFKLKIKQPARAIETARERGLAADASSVTISGTRFELTA